MSFRHAAPIPETLFQPALGHQAIAVLLLVENSRNLSFNWPYIRDQYLRTLLARFEENPRAPVHVFLWESQSNMTTPRQCSGVHECLEDIQFNSAPNNVISSGMLSAAAQFLATRSIGEQVMSPHLVIVAASSPMDNIIVGQPQMGHSPWDNVSQQFSKAGIHCHMVLNMNEDMTAFMRLFDHTLRLQKNIERSPWFPTDPSVHIVLRLSASPYFPSYSDTILASGIGIPENQLAAPPNFPQNLRKPQSLSIASINGPEDFVSEQTGKDEPPEQPSLVAQLQQVHGLTKKKVYGAKPTRQPFLRDERVKESSRRSSVSLVPPTSPGGRTSSKTISERSTRVRRRPSAPPLSPAEPIPPPLFNEYPVVLPPVGSVSYTPPISPIIPNGEPILDSQIDIWSPSPGYTDYPSSASSSTSVPSSPLTSEPTQLFQPYPNLNPLPYSAAGQNFSAQTFSTPYTTSTSYSQPTSFIPITNYQGRDQTAPSTPPQPYNLPRSSSSSSLTGWAG
ncbi:hypothetical protein C8J56DRAFT_363022 [Mycena floridula]|nr:hypothetical protein C8J56DRAFT_363022 [Mycena floridula]